MSVHCHVYLYLSFRGLPPLNILFIVSATFPVLFCLFYILFSSYVVGLKLRECILVIRLAEPTETVHWSFWKSKFTFWVCVCVCMRGDGGSEGRCIFSFENCWEVCVLLCEFWRSLVTFLTPCTGWYLLNSAVPSSGCHYGIACESSSSYNCNESIGSIEINTVLFVALVSFDIVSVANSIK
jgi:hypothetical protein